MSGLFGQVATRTYYQASRLGSMDQWWHWLVLVGVALVVLTFIIGVYRRDGHDLRRPTRWLLFLLRIGAFVGILIFFLQIEKRTEQKLVKNSRAIVLIDTSQSMGLSDLSTVSDGSSEAKASRIEQVAATLDGGLVENLRDGHDVIVYGFDQSDRPTELASLPKTGVNVEAGDDEIDPALAFQKKQSWARIMFAIAAVLIVIAVLAVIAHLVLGRVVRNQDGESWALLVTVACCIVAAVLYSVSNLRYPEIGWSQAFGGPDAYLATNDDGTSDSGADENGESDSVATNQTIEWDQLLQPRGAETRLGDAIQFVVDKEQGGPIAGITVFTDGNVNAGVDFRSAINAAQQTAIPVHLVGIGDSRRPTNIKIIDLEAPARVYPGDMFTIRGFAQGYGVAGKGITAKLFSQPDEDADKNAKPTQVDEQVFTAGPDGDVRPVEFEVTPEQLGAQRYTIEVSGIAQDLDEGDNRKSQTIQIVDRKNRVLLLAGGPTREYRFVRTLLYRDPDTTVDVILQSSPVGAAQESDKVLDEFPSTAEDLFEYDCIVAFDPNWEELELPQVQLLDRWVAEKAGGLILVAGPVFTPEWTTLRRESRATGILKGLYPVTFFSRTVTRLARGKIVREPSPIKLSPAGEQSRFLWLDDSSVRSKERWIDFAGVYGAYPVRGLKPIATLHASIEQSRGKSDTPPVFIAEQFYGAGRVLYLGTGELWRLRMDDPALFEQLYTKFVRHVSQGRLLRDSSRGVLMVEKDRCVLGETVSVRASLSDSQFRPLELESVEADLVTPDGTRKPIGLRLVKDAPRPGTYAGQFSAVREGDYRIELIVPESDDLDMLTSEVRVRVPELEVENPQRNDAIMNEIASATGGTYFAGLDSLNSSQPNLPATLVPQDQETYLPGTPDRRFQQRLMGWLMALICGVLSLEWLLRRLHRLA